MAKDYERLRLIYSKTDGYCHICFKKLSFKNHGLHSGKGSWHIEHSKAKAKGGTDHLNNLFAACINCNLSKGIKHTKTVRRHNGQTRAPYSRATKRKIRQENTASGAVIGGLLGLLGGPAGAVIGATIGGTLGNSSSPRR